MYPQHTGSILLDIAYLQRNELIRDAENRRRVAANRRTTSGTSRPSRHPWWWGLARSHRAA